MCHFGLRTMIFSILGILIIPCFGFAGPAEKRAQYPPLIEPGKDFGDDPGSIIKRFVRPLQEPEKTSHRAVLSTDSDHAESIAPVLTRDEPVYIHFFRKQGSPDGDKNFILENGRIFINHAAPYDIDEMPSLRIRPIDGDCDIPFLIEARLKPVRKLNEHGTLDIIVRMPSIFNPNLVVNSITSATRTLDYQISKGSSVHTTKIVIPLSASDLEPYSDQDGPAMQILINGVIQLDRYRPVPSHRFTNFDKLDMDPRLASIAMLLSGRDFWGDSEKEKIHQLAAEIISRTDKDYERVILANRFVGSQITYYRNSMRRTAMQVLAEGIGDCDDYTRVMMALLRAMNIPCTLAVGYLYDFNSMGAHAWVDVGLATKENDVQWFICDPTLASVTDEKDYFVQFLNRFYLYNVSMDVVSRNLPVDESTDILLNWREKETSTIPPQAFHSAIHSFRDNLEQSLFKKANALNVSDLDMDREFLFALGSSYVLADREVTPDQSRLQLKLDSNEQLVMELSVQDDEYDLEDPANQEAVEKLRKAYRRMKNLFFPDFEARFCLELSFVRDKHSDRLQKVTLQMFRYLVEHHFSKIISAMEKESLITKEEADRLDNLYQISAGKNLYYLQELVRRQPSRLDTVSQALADR